MRVSNLFILITLSWVLLCINGSYQLQNFQAQVLLQLKKQLEHPLVLKTWDNYNGDFCYMASTPQMSIKCENDSVSEIRIVGDKVAKVSGFNGFSVVNKTLSKNFSMDYFVTTLARLGSLKSLSLVSLGIWGSVPDKIHRLASLETLDLSSNFIYGSVPHQMSRLAKMQSLTLDANYFNGTIPNWLDSLTNLTVLSTRNNKFKGHIPLSVRKLVRLTDLSLMHNGLSGKIPDLSSLTSLHVLDLRQNRFHSELPALPKQLVTALLSRNSLEGEIAAEKVRKLDKLQHLDLSFNFLTRTPPSVLFSLPKISYLDLSSNHLSGSLSNNLRCGSELGFVDISNNKFIGKLPSCFGTTSNERVVNFGGNCLSFNKKFQHQESYCKNSHKVVKLKRSVCKNRGALVGGAVLVLILCAFGAVVFRKRRHSHRAPEQCIFPKVAQGSSPLAGVSAALVKNARFISQSVKFGAQGASVYHIFSLEELKDATNNFDQMALMGEGSLGKIYKGRLENGTHLAVRSITFHKRQPIQSLKCQLESLSKLHHSHLVSLLGHCIDGDGADHSYATRVFLVYEYVPIGNYRAHLSEYRQEKALKWSDRLTILIGVAKAVHFLHTGMTPRYLSNQLKTHNILLDEHYVGKLSDYGMFSFEEHENHELKGQDLKSRQMASIDDDVYNFGFILLESLVGPILSGKGEAYLLSEMTSFGSQDGQKRIVDPMVLNSCSQESLSIVVSITNKCISLDSFPRPSFEDVLWNLHYAAQVQAWADADPTSESSLQL